MAIRVNQVSSSVMERIQLKGQGTTVNPKREP